MGICRDSAHTGSDEDASSYKSRGFYDSQLEMQDSVEQDLLVQELGAALFPVCVMGGDAKENFQGARAYVVSQADNGKFKFTSRVLSLKLHQSFNHESVFEQIQSSLGSVGWQVSQVGSWVADGCDVNGVQ